MKQILYKILSVILLLLAFSFLSCQEDVRELRDSDPWIVYGSSRDGKIDVYAINPITKEEVFVAGTDSSIGTVRYDPFKNRIIFPCYDEDPIGMLTDGETDLLRSPNKDVPPTWSSKGKIAYCVESEAGGNLFIANTDGTNETQITNDPEIERYPTYNPNGDKLVYAKQVVNGWDLFMLDIATREEIRLTELESYVGHPSWSPDSKKIAFDTIYDGQAEIAMLNIESGKVTRITNRPGNDLIPSWAPDSFTIAFGGDLDNKGNWDIWTIDIETKEVRKWTEQPGFDGGPIFVPYSAIKELVN